MELMVQAVSALLCWGKATNILTKTIELLSNEVGGLCRALEPVSPTGKSRPSWHIFVWASLVIEAIIYSDEAG